MKKIILFIIVTGVFMNTDAQSFQQYQPVGFSQVAINDNFWKPKIDKVATVTLNSCIYQTEVKTPRIRNFEKVARNKGEKFEGRFYDDSDVYKALEAIAYSLKTHPNPELEKKADEWIDKIAAAQLPDGYIGTYYTLVDLSKRWTSINDHEDYNAGHLIEAAVAYYHATGKRKILDVAIKFANHIDSTFRIPNKYWISGHQEIELALVKLYKVTNNENYLKLAEWYLNQRGRGYTNNTSWGTPQYWQDYAPVKQQREITGHAVRAMYLYSGAADVASLLGDAGYMDAMKTIWEDVVYRNMYLTGGIGSSGDNEGFSKDYDLPNADAYCETCASVGMVFWNHRMNQLTGDAKYIDVLERSLYNGALDGLSLSGDRFFYDNPLASNGQHQRREWFGTACCPSNISRLVVSVGDYIYGKTSNSIWVNLFIGSETKIALDKNEVNLHMQTNYPYDGNVKLNVDPSRKGKFKLYMRIPGWAAGEPVPGDLYKYVVNSSNAIAIELKVNGKKADYKTENGYAVVEREWKKGDVVEMYLPMKASLVASRDEIVYNKDRVAVQRGPLVYCAEGADNEHEVWNVFLPTTTVFSEIDHKVLGEPVVSLRAELPTVVPDAEGSNVLIRKRNITFIPYYTWANRGAEPMQVWLPTKIRELKIVNGEK